MKAEYAVAEWVEQRTQTPDGLQAAGSDAHFALFFFVHVRRTVFHGVGVGAIGNGISTHHDAQREDEIVQ